MAKTYKVEEKAGIGTDQNLSDTTGWTVHGTTLSAAATEEKVRSLTCLLYTSPSPRDRTRSRMPSSA